MNDYKVEIMMGADDSFETTITAPSKFVAETIALEMYPDATDVYVI